jgi:hypothetical protein
VLSDAGFERDEVRSTLMTSDPDADDAIALRTIGIDIDAVRNAVSANFGPDEWRRAGRPRRRMLFGKPLREPFTLAMRRSLENAMRATVDRRDRRIADEHLILGLTRNPTDMMRRIVEDRLPLAELRARALMSLDRADVA